MHTKHPIAVLSKTKKIVPTPSNPNEITKKEISHLYKQSNWRNTTTYRTLTDIIQSQELLVIRTDNLLVVDFDDNTTFSKALAYNKSLAPKHQCNFIVQSARKGGHFYFTPNKDIPELVGHTKQPIFDYLTGPGHNVIAPTSADEAKTVIVTPKPEDSINTYSQPWDMFLQVIILSNVDNSKLNIIVSTQPENHSDDNVDFVKLYLANSVTQQSFNKFYNVPDPIPQGMSNEYYLKVSTRLGCDETISWEDYSQAMIKFNLYHQRKSPSELSNEIMQRMKPTGDEATTTSRNSLWRYNPNKVKDYSFTHKTLKTKISPYYDNQTGEYLISYLDENSQSKLIVRKSKSLYLDIMEKLVTAPQSIKKTENIPVVTSVTDYSQEYGYNPDTHVFNRAIVSPELAAFYGARPHNYKTPDKLLEVCHYMWGEEYDYLMSSTKFRYTTFKFSPVVTFLQGTEGSGKDLTISLLTRGFPHRPQLLNAQLVRDVHANWQTEPNAIVSELGDWRSMDKENLLGTIKTISGSQGIVTYRGMQQTAITVQSLIKIWVTGNSWVKLHTDPLSQRRIYPVYMPNPLSKIMGGPYTEGELREIFSAENILNFYYYLGNEYPNTLSIDEYMTPQSRKSSLSYQLYKDATESIPDKVSELLWVREWKQFKEVMALYNFTLSDLIWKFSRAGNLVVTVDSLKRALRDGGAIVEKTIDRLKVDKEGNKRLKFDKPHVEHFITIYSAPKELEGGIVPKELDSAKPDGLD